MKESTASRGTRPKPGKRPSKVAEAADIAVELGGDGTKASRTRARVLEATAKVLNREGYAGTKLGHISELAELQAPAIYYHFPSREAVIEETVATGQRITTRYVTAALEALPEDTPSLERILVAATAHLEATLRWSEFCSASTRCFPQLPLDMQERLGALRREYGFVWKNLFEDAVYDKELRADLDTFSAMMLTLGALNWATEWWDGERGDLDTLLKSTRTFLANALSRGKP